MLSDTRQKLRRNIALALWILVLGLSQSACSGRIFFESKCANVNCQPGLVCDGTTGQCVSNGIATCTPVNISGACSGGDTCSNGICYDTQSLPAVCQAGVNGTCDNNGSCQAGTCVPITADNACSLDLPAGFCPGGQACVDGYCFVDDGNVLCSPTNLNGACGIGQSCVGGTCQAFIGTCGPTNINGTCGTWQVCSEGDSASLGVCVGPFAPDACSADHPAGRCPADEVCVSGTCTPITTTNVCSPSNTTGLCSAQATCQAGGQCVYLDSNVACSSTHLTGACAGGATCRNGVCQTASCSSGGGYACPNGQWCDAGVCMPVPCDPVHPEGACVDTTLACVNGICAPPTCSADNPYGVCSQGLACFAGQCLLPACSASSPSGPCPDLVNQVCQDGVCVIGPCSTTRPKGSCNERVCTNDPAYGCVLTMPAVCIDQTLASATGQTFGSCGIPLCSASNPNGYCDQGKLCVGGSCQAAACGPFFLTGICQNPNANCTQGRCTLLNCLSHGATQTERDAYCAPQVCDSNNTGNCITPACSPAHPTGTCSSGQACCNVGAQNPNDPANYDANCTAIGTCDSPTCSLKYPGGSCPTGKLCASGVCQTPPCSATYPNGTCGPNYKCTSGTCVQQACSATYPGGTCPSGKRCSSGSCVTYQCSATFPQAPCANSAQICSSGTCVTPSCSTSYPGGSCPTPKICSAGVCTTPPCSSSVQNGTCPAHETCCNSSNAGTLLDCSSSAYGKCVENNCNSANPAGACSGSQVCYTSSSGTTSCQTYTCSANFPNGPCSTSGTTCIGGTCQQPNCDASHPGGKCASPQLCNNGTCVYPACSASNPNGACPSSQNCNATTHRCTLSACSPSAPAGYCNSGYACCNSSVAGASGCASSANYGTCVATTCSTTFPYGKCANANTVCINANCVYPCGPTQPRGYCPGGFACVERVCAAACANDQDCDGISDADEGLSTLVDTDGDGVPDAYDHDSDGDTIPDSVEAGDHNILTPPVDTDGDGIPNFRSLDSDGDHIPDRYEAGPAPGVPRDTDSDGKPDYIDTDSDGDGILDRCEAIDIAGKGICANTALLNTNTTPPLDTDGDGIPDYRDLDSDGDSVPDHIEARSKPFDDTTFASTGVDHDGDGKPDYRDLDSDGDGVVDSDEDVNGDGIVNCQVDGNGATVADSRTSPVCNSTSSPFSSSAPYNYNPGCITNGQKCLLAETNRVYPDTDGNGIGDGSDGIYLVCSASNLKPVNLFFSQAADYAYALEPNFSRFIKLTQSAVDAGLVFDDASNNPNSGSYAVSGMLIKRTPSSTAMAVTPSTALIQKALAQASVDQAALAADSNISAVSLVISRNTTSFDGYGVVISRYNVTTKTSMATSVARDIFAKAMAPSLDSFASVSAGPSATAFTLNMETLYRYDNGSNAGTVLLAGAVTQTGASQDTASSYTYRTLCPNQTSSATCGARLGCSWNGSSCVQTSYQLPLFYADNIANGSGLTQYGDDLEATCQSLIQKNPLVDFLWTVDNSGSMVPKIGRVANASALFFPLLNSSEADYRVAMTATASSSLTFPPVFGGCHNLTSQGACESSTSSGGCSWIASPPAGQSQCQPICTPFDTNQTMCQSKGCVYTASNAVGTRCQWGGCSALTTSSLCSYYNCTWSNNACQFTGIPDRVDGVISHDFTGAIAGITSTSSTDRTVNYSCNQNCTSPANTCNSSSYNSLANCPTSLGCAWNGTACVMNCCPSCLGNTSAVPNDPACYFAARLPNDTGSGYEYGLLMTEWALFRAGVQPGCAANASQATCLADPGCIWSNNTCSQGYCAWNVTPNDPNNQGAQQQCNGYDPSVPPPALPYTPPYPAEDLMPGNCEWDTVTAACTPSFGTRCASYTNTASCNAQSPRCNWSGGVCQPGPNNATTLCNATSQAGCVVQGNGFCQWDTCNYTNATACGSVYGCAWTGTTCQAVANAGTCRPPLKRMMRANATPVSLIVSDEEECFVKDGPNSTISGNKQYDGNCASGYYTGGLMLYNDPVRLARVSSYSNFMQARNMLTFALAGDKASATQAPPVSYSATGNGGCYTPAGAGVPSAYYAEPGQAYINVAESTGGGWGSICAVNLYPSIEAMVTSSLGKASLYKLNGYIKGNTVQPIASTIKVATQTCINQSEYPGCASGTKVSVVPRSRDNGWDYDSVNNSLVLYGSARPVTQGSITVSYRYWDNTVQPPQGTPNGCPCPATSSPSCACPTGEVCGKVGSTDNCVTKTSSISCGAAPGCVWNTANGGFCEVTGLCEPDPTCGGSCGTGLTCDPLRGLCVCDQSCGGSCAAGSTCDNNENIHACQGLSQSNCTISGCSWNATTQACTSSTCGMCLCDTTCGGGCPAGSTCNSNTSSATCGQCACDTTCGGGCPTNQTCNTDTTSATCGFCEPPQCGHCPSGFVCNNAANACICDQTCGGSSCAQGSVCDGKTSSTTCGQCVCDTTCGGGCAAGQTCNTDPNSSSCGFCQLDTTCGGCNPTCSASTSSACNATSGCRWAPWLNSGSGGCSPATCRTCDSSTGLCHADTTCCGACGPNESCDSTTGQCKCDTTCGGCPAGQTCNSNTADVAGCGSCVCDTTCGATCPQGEVCDSNTSSSTCGFCKPDPTCGVGGMCNPACSATTLTACNNSSGCQWESYANSGAGACGPIACKVCNTASGLCTTDTTCCGGCGPGQTCNVNTGSCVCDTSCGGGCTASGTVCDSNLSDGTCGQCICDTTCGGSCPAGEVCDTNSASGTCGSCIIDTTCGGSCPYPLVCNPSTGLCGPDPHCGGCASNYTCNLNTGQCVPPGG